MSDIQLGDVVVCVESNCGGAHTNEIAASPLVVGRTYRVTKVYPKYAHWDCPGALSVAGLPAYWCRDRFRKIRPADEQFTSTVKACRPKQRERVA